MIEKEALNVMTQAREDAGQAFLGKVQFNVPQYHAVIKALDKQIPKRAISVYKGNYKCPTCENYIDITDDDLYVYEIEPPKYCDECGQALDWGDEECGS